MVTSRLDAGRPRGAQTECVAPITDIAPISCGFRGSPAILVKQGYILGAPRSGFRKAPTGSVPRAVASAAPGEGYLRESRSLPLAVLIRRLAAWLTFQYNGQ